VGDKVAIQFVSDVVYIDNLGSNSVDVASFAKELSTSGALGFAFTLDRSFVRTSVAGGYNAHWRLPKRQYVAFDKGSVLVVTVTGCEDGTVDRLNWTGLLNEEGYGQLLIQKTDGIALDNYIKVRPAELHLDGCDEVHEPESHTEETECRVSFERDLAYNEARERAVLEACQLGDMYELGAASKSSFMRVSSIYRSACKDGAAGGAKGRFLSLANENLADDEALNKQCKKLCDSYDALMHDYGNLTDACKDGVFKSLVQGYLRQVKVRYSTLKGDLHA
jgi:hypothetical protein